MYENDLGISNLFMKCFGISNISMKNYAARISSVGIVPECLRKLKSLVNKFNIHVSFLLCFSLHAIVICQKYFRITVI